MVSSSIDATNRDAFEQLAAAFLERYRQGEQPEIDRFAEQYPEHATQLKELLPTLLVLEEIAPLDVDSTLAITPQRSLGDFLIIRQIGRGGMGVVYEAEQISLKRTVALKVLPFATLMGRDQLQRFRNEALAAATLKHPNIVSVYAVGCERGVNFYAMEYVEGSSLAEVIEQLAKEAARGPAAQVGTGERNTGSSEGRAEQSDSSLSSKRRKSFRDYVRAVVELGIQAADALEHAHSLGIIHRDIKPSNLLLDASGKLWITDFGLAQIESATNLTMTGDILGTLRYMSPEQASGQRVLDSRSDIYSLGVTLYELLTLKPAFPDTDRKKLLAQVISSEPIAPRKLDKHLPQDVDTIILKAIAQDTNDRYASAHDLADDLRRFLNGQATRAKPPTVYTRVVKWSARNPAVVAATFTVLLVISTATAIGNYMLRREWLRAEGAESVAREAEQNMRIEAANAQRAAASAKAINRFLTDYVLAKADPSSGTRDGSKSFRDALDNASQYADRWFPQEPDLRGSLYRTIAQLYARLGEYEQSAEQFRKALDLLRAAKVPESDVLECMNGLGLTQFELNHVDEAETWLRQSLEQARDSLGDRDAVTLTAMMNLAKVLLSQHREEAESLARQCWETRKQALGHDHPDTAIAAVGLASILVTLEKLPAAEGLLIPAVVVLREHRGIEDLETQSGIHALARIYEHRKEFDLAGKFYREILEARTRIQGSDHSLTLSIMTKLASLLEMQGRLAEAETLTRRILQTQQTRFGEDNKATQATRNHLASLFWKQGKLNDAVSIYNMRTVIDPVKDLGTLEFAVQYCDVLLGLGKYADAESLMRRCWDVGKKELGLNHPASRDCIVRLVLSLYCQRKIFEAERLDGENGVEIWASEDNNSSGQPELRSLQYFSLRRPNPWTEWMLKESLQYKRATLPKSHLSIAMTLAILGQDLMTNQKAQEAEPLLHESLAIRREALPGDHWLIAESESLLGECLAQLNRHEEAEPLLVKSCQAVQNSEELVAAVKLEYVERICALYERWDNREQNARWQIQLEKLLRACLDDWRKSAPAHDRLVMTTESRLGECLGLLGRFAEAEEILLKTYALLRLNDSWSGEPYPAAANLGSLLDQCRERLTRLYQSWERPEELSLWQKLGQLFPSSGEYATVECHNQGIAIWDHVCKRDPNPLFRVRLARAYSDLGIEYFFTEQPQEAVRWHLKAIDQLQSLLADEPKNELALEHLAATLASMGDALSDLRRYSEARDAFEKAVAIADRLPDDESNSSSTRGTARRAPFKLAMFLAECQDPNVGNPQRALQIAQETEHLKKDRGMILAQTLAHYRAGEMQAAIDMHDQMSAGSIAGLVVAMAYQKLGANEKARLHYDTVVARSPLLLQGGIRGGEGSLNREARRLIIEASEVLGINKIERDAILDHWRGMRSINSGQAAAAVESFHKAIELKPDYAEPHMGLAMALDQIQPRDVEAATKAIEKYFALKPKNPDAQAYTTLGILKGRKGNLDASIEALAKVTELQPYSGLAFSNLGFSHSIKGNYSEAIKAYEKAAELIPGAKPRNDLAWLLATCADHAFRDPQRAVELATDASKKEPDNSEHWRTLGVARYSNGNYQQAIEALKKSVELANEGGGIDFLFLAMAHCKLGDKDQSQLWYKKGTDWMDQNQPVDKELERFRIEAEVLMNVSPKVPE